MRVANKPQGSRLRTHIVAQGSYGAVRLSDEAKAAYDALNAAADEMRIRESVSIRRYFERFAEIGPIGLDNPKMFKSLGRFKDGTGKKVQVFEFKAFQFRLYGVLRDVGGVASFVGLCCDPSKKKDKADQSLLARCARLASNV